MLCFKAFVICEKAESETISISTRAQFAPAPLNRMEGSTSFKASGILAGQETEIARNQAGLILVYNRVRIREYPLPTARAFSLGWM